MEGQKILVTMCSNTNTKLKSLHYTCTDYSSPLILTSKTILYNVIHFCHCFISPMFRLLQNDNQFYGATPMWNSVQISERKNIPFLPEQRFNGIW